MLAGQNAPKVITVLLRLSPYFLSFRPTSFNILEKMITCDNALLTVLAKLCPAIDCCNCNQILHCSVAVLFT